MAGDGEKFKFYQIELSEEIVGYLKEYFALKSEKDVRNLLQRWVNGALGEMATALPGQPCPYRQRICDSGDCSTCDTYLDWCGRMWGKLA